MQQGPGQYSPDGRWWWDGQRWVAVERPAAKAAASSNRNLLLIVGAVVLVGVLGICGMGVCALALGGSGAGLGTPSGDITGVYALKQIDDHDVPAGGSFNHVVFDGTLELRTDGTYVLRFNWQGETGAMRYTGDDGPYTRTGNTVTFSPKDESYQYTGALGDGAVLITYDWDRNGKTDRFLFRR